MSSLTDSEDMEMARLGYRLRHVLEEILVAAYERPVEPPNDPHVVLVGLTIQVEYHRLRRDG